MIKDDPLTHTSRRPFASIRDKIGTDFPNNAQQSRRPPTDDSCHTPLFSIPVYLLQSSLSESLSKLMQIMRRQIVDRLNRSMFSRDSLAEEQSPSRPSSQQGKTPNHQRRQRGAPAHELGNTRLSYRLPRWSFPTHSASVFHLGLWVICGGRMLKGLIIPGEMHGRGLPPRQTII